MPRVGSGSEVQQTTSLYVEVRSTTRFLSAPAGKLVAPGDGTVPRAHDLCEEIEREVRAILPRASVLTHLEPVEDPLAGHDSGTPEEPMERSAPVEPRP